MRLTPFCVLATTVLLGCAEAQSPSQRTLLSGPSNTEKNVIVFADGKLTLQGETLDFPFTVSELVAVLGPFDRQFQKENILSTWDGTGIVAYEKSPGAPINCLSIAFQNRGYDFSPTHNFAGTIRYNGSELTANSTREELSSAGLKQHDILPFLHVADDGDFRIIAQFDNGLADFSINATSHGTNR